MLTDKQLAEMGISPENYSKLSEEEKEAVTQILMEMSAKNSFDTYEELYYTDYKEIPVNYNQFISDDQYLGKATRKGTQVYDFWKREGERIFTHADCVEIALSGSIGIGKTYNACLMMCYHLYKTMCMKDPQSFFNLSPGSEITYAFLNNTLASSTGVGFDTMQSFLKESPWFLKHGRIAGRENLQYVPEDGFGFIIGSRPQHTLGRHIICLTGDTNIITTQGIFKLEDLVDKEIRVFTYSYLDNALKTSSVCTVKQTGIVTDLIEITLLDDTIIKCTPEHRFMLYSGEYCEAQNLSIKDALMGSKIKNVKSLKLDSPMAVYDVINVEPYHNFIIKTNDSMIVSHNCALMDEVSFAPGQNVQYEKSKIMDLYTNIRRRMDSRFMVNGKNYGKMFLVSSKATESSFLEAYIADQVKKGYPIYVVDQPLWKVKPGAYSGKYFKVAVGNKFIPSKIVTGDTEEAIQTACAAYKEQGLTIIDVPIEHRQPFDQDLDKALQDIAGISTAVVTKVFSGERIQACIGELENPFRTEVVTLGTHDDLKLQDFFDVSKIPDNIYGAPVFIHLDASVSGDRTGLSGVAIIGTRQSTKYGVDIDEKELVDEIITQQVFTVGIQAPADSEISFEKTRQFIYWLKDEVGLNIKLVSTDGFQSVDTRQILQTRGYETGYTSLDRTPDGYDSLKSAITDSRIILLRNCDELYDELMDLERDNMTRKYDHPINGKKDEADSLAGAHYDALQYKEEYMFFHPEDYDYEGINDSVSDEQKFKNQMISNLVSTKPKKSDEGNSEGTSGTNPFGFENANVQMTPGEVFSLLNDEGILTL